MHVLLNWLWQGTALTLLVALSVHARPTMNAATRERVWWITIIAVVIVPVAHLLNAHAGGADSHAISPAVLAAPLVTVKAPPNGWTVWLVAVWAGWGVVSLARVGVALVCLRSTKKLATPLAGDRETRLRIWTAMRDHGRPTRLVVSARVHRAGVLGLGQPLIALSPDTISRLTDEELDQVVVHEYAHVQRRDDCAIVVQRVISAVAGLHPAIWWLDRALETEREVACDDWVVMHTRAAKRYAACLVKLAASGGQHRWSISPGAALSRSQLATRIGHLLDGRRNGSVTRSNASLRLALPAVFSLALAGAAIPLIGVIRHESRGTLEGPIARDLRTSPSAPEMSATETAEDMAVSRPPASSQPTARRGTESAARPDAPPPAPLEAGTQAHSSVVEVAIAEAAATGQNGPSSSDLQETQVRAAGDPLPATVFAQIAPSADPRAGTVEGAVQDPPWKRAADVGLAIGNGSRHAAMKTAGSLSRLGKSIAGSF